MAKHHSLHGGHYVLALSCMTAALTAQAQDGAFANAVTVSGNKAAIAAVTLYPGIASVQRSVRIPAGTRQLVFECLPANIDPQSLQVSADAEVRIGDYKTLLQPRDMASKSCASPLDKQILALEDQLATINADEGAGKLVAEYLQNLTKPEETTAPAANQIAATSTALRNSSRENSLHAHQVMRQKQTLEEQLKPLLAERERTGATRGQVMKLSVQLATNNEASVQLTYQVRGPSWQPSYRAQLNADKGVIELERQALVAQTSGEDWSNVQLTLSTGQPTRNTQGRMPSPWVLDVQQPMVAAVAPAPAPSAPMSRSSKLMLTDVAQEAALPQLDVSSINTAYNTQFSVPYKISVPSSGERVTLSLGRQSLPAQLLTRTAPAVEEAAYLVATISAPAGIWPAGPVALFRDAAFVGNGRLDFGNAQSLAQGLAFGRDEKIVVRNLPQDASTGRGGFINSNTQKQILQRYTVENRHDRAITLQVIDAAPISRNSKISVQSQYSPEPASTRWNQQNGMVAWQQSLAAGATAEFKAEHQIRYPDDVSVDERR